MSASWPEAKLADLVDIKHGFAFKGEFFTDEPTGVVLLTPGNFAIGGGIQFNKLKFYKDGPIPADYMLAPGDLLVTMTDLSKAGDTLGYSAVVPAGKYTLLHNQRLGKVIAKNEGIDLRFVHWLLRDGRYRAEVLGSATGSTVKHTSPGRIGAYRFPLPPLPEQRAIATTLGALDDKIELNRKMNATLEAMARALFRDWFVDFGPTRAKMADLASYLSTTLWPLFPDCLDESGKPEGWEVFKLGQIAEHHTKTLTPERMAAVDVEHFSLPAFDKGQTPALDAGATIKSNKTIIPSEAVLLSKLNPEIPRVWMPEAPSGIQQVSSTEFLAFTAKAGAGRSLLFCLFSDQGFREMLHGMVTGTSKSHQRISPPSLLGRQVIAGTSEMFGAFEQSVAALLERVRANRAESRTLAQTRDLLLPRLMSGELRVADLAPTERETAA